MVWEKEPRVFRQGGPHTPKPPLHQFDELLGVLRTAEREGSHESPCHVLVMRDGFPTAGYASSASAYLDGCSVIVNHAEAVCHSLKQLCTQLRKDVPHAYVNLYLTPPNAQAVAAHADDRDVLVWQAAGSKRWKVYDSPIRFPYPEEQVGKSEECPVPEETLEAEPRLEVTLREGDVLYMPRGFVHEAFTSEEAPSLHLTIAMATYDWSWHSIIQFALQVEAEAAGESAAQVLNHLTESVTLRKSVPPALICREADDPSFVAACALAQAVIDSDPRLKSLTPEALQKAFALKVQAHNSRQDSTNPAATQPCLTGKSYVRRITQEERDKAKSSSGEEGAPQQGLMAREEIADNLLAILGGLTTKPLKIEDFQDSPMLCQFSKLCFAQVCVDMGLLCACDADGNKVACQ